jgi:hypothetical protein
LWRDESTKMTPYARTRPRAPRDFMSRVGRPAAAFVFAAVALAGCGGMRPAPVFTDRQLVMEDGLPIVAREDLLNEVSLYHGVPYKAGGKSTSGVDCSGLVLEVLAPLGVKMPRTVVEQFATGISIGRKNVRTGDLVFFGRQRVPEHVGIAVSGEEMVHASASRGVAVDKISDFAETTKFRGARRVVLLK